MKYINMSTGEQVDEYNAFCYAIDKCTSNLEDMEDFLKNFMNGVISYPTMEELIAFRKDLVEWFFSGDWIRLEDEEEEADEPALYAGQYTGIEDFIRNEQMDRRIV